MTREPCVLKKFQGAAGAEASDLKKQEKPGAPETAKPHKSPQISRLRRVAAHRALKFKPEKPRCFPAAALRKSKKAAKSPQKKGAAAQKAAPAARSSPQGFDDDDELRNNITTENTEDGTAGVRDEGASSRIDGCGAQPDGTLSVAGGATARTGDGMLGETGPQGVAQAPMADTDTEGTVECEVHAGGTSGAEGRGMDASDGFEVFATRSEPVPGAVGWSATGPEWRP